MILAVIGAAVAGFILAALVALGLAVARQGRLFRTAPARLAVIACPRCRNPVGVQAAAAARADWQARTEKALADARRLHRRVRVDPNWRFHCPACGAALIFDPSGTALTATDAEPDAVAVSPP